MFSKTLMQWREPKIKGMVTFKYMLTALGLVLLVSIPFGFLGGNGKYSISISLIALGFMGFALIGQLTAPLMPGTKIRLKEDAIVRVMPQRNKRSMFEDIDSIYFYRNCIHSWEDGILVVKTHKTHIRGPHFTNFGNRLKKSGYRQRRQRLFHNAKNSPSVYGA